MPLKAMQHRALCHHMEARLGVVDQLEEFANTHIVGAALHSDDPGPYGGARRAGAFMVAKFDGTEVVYQDGMWRGHVLEDHEDVRAFSRIWMTVHGAVFNKAASVELIAKVAKEWSA